MLLKIKKIYYLSIFTKKKFVKIYIYIYIWTLEISQISKTNRRKVSEKYYGYLLNKYSRTLALSLCGNVYLPKLFVRYVFCDKNLDKFELECSSRRHAETCVYLG